MNTRDGHQEPEITLKVGEKNYTQEELNQVQDGNQEPTEQVETTVTEEDTSTKNEEAGSEKDATTNTSSKIINELGEDKKKLAEDLIFLARESETAKDVVESRIKSDPKLETYFKKKFGEDYDTMFQKPTEGSEPLDVEQIREEERIKAKADILLEQMESSKAKSVENFAVQKGFNSDELLEFKKYVGILESEVDLDAAMSKAALLVNADKAQKRSSVDMPKGDVGVKPVVKSSNDSPELRRLANRLGRNPDEFVQSIDKINDTFDGKTFKLNF